MPFTRRTRKGKRTGRRRGGVALEAERVGPAGGNGGGEGEEGEGGELHDRVECFNKRRIVLDVVVPEGRRVTINRTVRVLEASGLSVRCILVRKLYTFALGSKHDVAVDWPVTSG